MVNNFIRSSWAYHWFDAESGLWKSINLFPWHMYGFNKSLLFGNELKAVIHHLYYTFPTMASGFQVLWYLLYASLGHHP